jgi:indole-3-glycerol phosphate synthase
LSDLGKGERLIQAVIEGKKRRQPGPAPSPEPRPHVDILDRIETLKERGITPIVAEIKPRSPTAGPLRQGIEVCEMVGEMERADVAGISVLTEENFFGGSRTSLAEAAGCAKVPLLMKDFLTEEREIEEGARLGADMVLLIVRVLGDRLPAMYHHALDLGLTPLVEVHNASEMEAAAGLEPLLVGVNNRNLTNLTVSLDTTRRLARNAPAGALIVSESGIGTREDVIGLQEYCDAFLVGSALMRETSVSRKIMELQGRG